MDTSELTRASQSGDHEAAETLCQLSNLGYTTPEAIASDIISRSSTASLKDAPTPVSDDALVELVHDFHRRAGTLTDAVSEELAKLRTDSYRVRLAHQPDFLPYRGIMAQFVLLDAIATRILNDHGETACQLYFVVDHDMSDKDQFTRAHFPDPLDRQGLKTLSVSLTDDEKVASMDSASPPAPSSVEEWVKLISDLGTLHNSHVPPENPHGLHPDRLEENVAFVRDLLEQPLGVAESLAEYNAMVMSRLVNDVLELPTLFVSLSALSTNLRPQYEYLLTKWREIKTSAETVHRQLSELGVKISTNLLRSVTKVPFWYLCPSCHARLPVTEGADGTLLRSQPCSSCGTSADVTFGTWDEPDLAGVSDRIAPRVIMDNLLDSVGFQVAGGVGYESSVEHVLLTHGIEKDLAWPVPTECYWRPTGLSQTPTEAVARAELADGEDSGCSRAKRALELIANGRATITYDLTFKGQEILHEWETHFQDNGEVGDPPREWRWPNGFCPD